MAAPVLESAEYGSVRNGAATSPATVTKPSGTASGDLLIACVVASSAGGRYFDTPSGWTSEDLTNMGSTNHYYLQTFSKVAGGSEPSSYDFDPRVQYVIGGVIIARVSGAEDPATTSLVIATASSGASGTCTAPSVTPTDADSLVLRFCGSTYNAAGSGISFATSTEAIEAHTNNVDCAMASFTQGASASGTETVTYTPTWHPSPVFGHIAVAIAPSSGGASVFPMNYYQQMRVR